MGLEKSVITFLLKLLITINLLLVPIMLIFEEGLRLKLILLPLLSLSVLAIFDHRNNKKNNYYESKKYNRLIGVLVIFTQAVGFYTMDTKLFGIMLSTIIIGDFIRFILIYRNQVIVVEK